MDEPMPNVWKQPLSHAAPAGGNPTLAIAALILGIVSIAVSILLTGLLFGIVGAILAIVCLSARQSGKTMAAWGLGASLGGILMSCIFGFAYYAAYLEGNKTMEDWDGPEDTESCAAEDWIGKPCPELVLPDVDGNQINLADLKGRKVILNFWSPGDILSRDAVPFFIEMRNTFPVEEVFIAGICTWEDQDVIRGVGRQLGINYPLVRCEELPAPLNSLYEWPATVFIDQNGVIQTIYDEYHQLDKLMSLASAPTSEASVTGDPNI